MKATKYKIADGQTLFPFIDIQRVPFSPKRRVKSHVKIRLIIVMKATKSKSSDVHCFHLKEQFKYRVEVRPIIIIKATECKIGSMLYTHYYSLVLF